MSNHDLIGRVVKSISGRDSGKIFIVIEVIDEQYILMSDGKLRTKEKPKKKKLKHLIVTDSVADEIRADLLCSNKVTNAMIRKFLQLKDIDKEV